jgi:predicted GH43/DUF377 family glycosyl hydrolase
MSKHSLEFESKPGYSCVLVHLQNFTIRVFLLVVSIFLAIARAAAADREVIPAKPAGPAVAPETMKKVYEEIKTPFKCGVILKGEAGKMVDCPSVFRMRGDWYMVYVCMNEVGYETHLARSSNLTHWSRLGKILSFRASGWDCCQADGGVALVDPTWGGGCELEKFQQRYWLSYLGGAKQGYEPDPLGIGIAWCKEPTRPAEWNRIEENPVLSTEQPDVREFERKTLYKSTIIHDRSESLGFPLVMFYNGKLKNGYERIGMAVSRDLRHWSRYGSAPVVANGEDKQRGMSGDPQIVKMEDLWVMIYFGAGWKPKAFDTFACSRDLVHWTRWDGPDLVSPSEPYDATYAHKPWLLKWKGTVYHFYCAVGDQGRVIALASSRPLPPLSQSHE